MFQTVLGSFTVDMDITALYPGLSVMDWRTVMMAGMRRSAHRDMRVGGSQGLNTS